MTAAALPGLLAEGLYRDNPLTSAAWRGNDLVTLVVAAFLGGFWGPIGLGCLIASVALRRGFSRSPDLRDRPSAPARRPGSEVWRRIHDVARGGPGPPAPAAAGGPPPSASPPSSP